MSDLRAFGSVPRDDGAQPGSRKELRDKAARPLTSTLAFKRHDRNEANKILTVSVLGLV